MRQIAGDERLPADVEAQAPVQAAAALRPVIRAYHDELEREQRLPKALVERAIERGYDPRDFAMVVYGGNGPIHAPLQAEVSRRPSPRVSTENTFSTPSRSEVK